MKVGFDTFHRFTASARRGIGRYGESLLNALCRLNEGDEYVAFEPAGDPLDVTAWEQQLRRFLDEQRPDVFAIPSPFEYSRPLPGRELLGACKLAAVIHDFIPLRFPQAYLNAKRLPWYRSTLDFLRDCDLVLANSETTKRDGVDLASIDESRIRTIYGGVDSFFSPGDVERTVLTGLGITREYVLYVGAFDFRKNVERLIRAFGNVSKQLKDRPQLILPSSDAKTSQVKNLKEIACNEGLGVDDLIFPGHVPDEVLVHLYRGAALFTLPSLWEGFGFPVVEAMACGTPALTSANSSMAEIAGDAALLVDPKSVSSIEEGILTAFRDPVLSTDLRARGRERAALFTWEVTAKRASAALRECVTRPASA